ncbi:MAG TPA: hypothetical protein PLV92_18785 [Pirellulaceae bacterium]|nr:hypothetical protein [Pirellulaceae bacterium]
MLKGLTSSAWTRLLAESLRAAPTGPRHLFVCVADHYEPDWGGASDDVRLERVDRWVREYPRSVAGVTDSLGRAPRHSFFFPLEEYRPRVLERLAELCHRGYGEVEVHLHHDRDTSDALREKFEWFRRTLHDEHGLLWKDERGEIRWGFIHGNWALDNSHPQGCWCGVNDELTILRETGCYADFTMPAAPDPAQTRTINSIYYATDDPRRPKSHDEGIAAQVGRQGPDDSLLMIQGPLALDWGDRKAGVWPRLENGDLHAKRPPSGRRIALWERASVAVEGRPDWLFAKLHTHGAKPANADVLLGEPMRRMHAELARRAEIDSGFRYYYVTAREMALLVHAAERGETDPQVVLRTSSLYESSRSSTSAL